MISLSLLSFILDKIIQNDLCKILNFYIWILLFYVHGFIKVIKKDPQVWIKINDMLDRYNRKPYNYQSEIRYDTLFQNVILKEMINIMGTTKVDKDIQLNLTFSRIEDLESRLLWLCSFISVWMTYIINKIYY